MTKVLARKDGRAGKHHLSSATETGIFDPLADRRLSLDLVPPGAYWRSLLPTESKIDFAQVEEAEGRLVTGVRIRLGLVFAAQMEAYVDWVRRPGFKRQRTRQVPLVFQKEIADELARMRSRAYYDGLVQVQGWLRNRDIREGRRPRPEDPEVALTKAGADSLRWKANLQAGRICRKVRDEIEKILERSFDMGGKRTVALDAIEAEIRSYYVTSLIEPTAEDLSNVDILELSATVTSRDLHHLVWEMASRPAHLKGLPPGKRRAKRRRPRGEEFIPYRKWIKQSAAKIRGGRAPTPQMRRNWARANLIGEITRFRTAATYDLSRNDPVVAVYTYTAIRDGRACPDCLARDGVTRLKRDKFWNGNSPPMHPG